jgi:hypothetical protein
MGKPCLYRSSCLAQDAKWIISNTQALLAEKGLKKDFVHTQDNCTLLLADMKMLGVSGTAFSEVISLDSNNRKKERRKERKKEEMTRKSKQQYGKTVKQVSAKLKAVLPRNLDYSKLKPISYKKNASRYSCQLCSNFQVYTLHYDLR